MNYERPSREEIVPEAESVPPPIPIDWWKLDADDRVLTLKWLQKFVSELIERYVLSEQIIPRCWHLHEPHIQELLGIFQKREQVNYDVHGGAEGGDNFHISLQNAIYRLRQWTTVSGCQGPEHLDDSARIPPWVRDPLLSAEWETDFDSAIKKRFMDGEKV